MRTEHTLRYRDIANIILIAILICFFSTSSIYGYSKVYGYQGSDKPIYIEGKGERGSNQIKLLDYEDGEITVEKTPDEADYFLNTIHREMDGTQRIEIPFSMTSGMNTPFDNEGKVNFEKNCLAGINEDGTERKSMVNIYKKTDEYTGGWNEDDSKEPVGTLIVDYDPSKTYKNPTNGDNQGRITLYISEDTLSAGKYILEFGRNVCGNNVEKTLGYPVAFEFVVQGDSDLETMLKTAKELYEYLSVSEGINIGSEEGQYDITQQDVVSFGEMIAEAEQVFENGNDESLAEMTKSLNERILEIEKKRIISLDAVISGIEEDKTVYVGDNGTLEKSISVSPETATNKIYAQAEWRAESSNITIDSKTGIWSADFEGNAKIALVSSLNGSVIKEVSFTVCEPQNTLQSFYIPSGMNLSDIISRAGVSPESLNAVGIICDSGHPLNTNDCESIRKMSNLEVLDISEAVLQTVTTSDKDENGSYIKAEGIPDAAFSDMLKLKTIVLPESVGCIGEGAFKGCTQLNDIFIPAGVKKIPEQCFENCSSLGTLTLYCMLPPEVAEGAFKDSNLSEIIVLPGCMNKYKADNYWSIFSQHIKENHYDELSVSVEQVGGLEDAVKSAIESLRMESGGSDINASDIDSLKIKTSEGVRLSYQKDIPYLQKNMLNAAVIDLQDAKIEGDDDKSSKLKSGLFKNRVNLKKIFLPEDAVNIARNVFYGCRNLEYILIPENVSSIGESAFYGCDSLKSLIICRKEPPLFDGSIGGINIRDILVPPDSIEEYQSDTGWGQYNILSQVTINIDIKNIILEAPVEKVLNATLTDCGYNGNTIFWESSNTGVATVSESTGKTVTIKGLKAGTATITASDATGKVKATCKVTVRNLPAPSVSTSSASYNSVKVSWSGVNGAQKYQLFRCDSKGNTTGNAVTLNSTARSYTFTGLATGTAYYYKVRAYKTVDGVNYYGDYSSLKSGIPTLSKPATPTVSRSSRTAVKVKWKGISGETGYQVYRATSANGKYSRVKSVKMASSLYPYAKIKTKKGKTYYYKVRAYKTVGSKTVYSSFSSPKKYKLK